MTLPGVDVSSFQGLPASWQKNAGSIQWAAVKLTELQPAGLQYVNPDAARDWEYLHNQHHGRVAYLFGHPAASAADSVALFAAELSKLGIADADGVALDLEVSDGLAAPKVAAWAQDVLTLLEHGLGRLPLVYTFRNFAAAGNCAGLGGYPLWISDPDHTAGQPQVPAPWTKAAIHQYATTGAIDRDVALYGTLAEMQTALGRRTPPAPEVVVKHYANGRHSLVTALKPIGGTVERCARLTVEHGTAAEVADLAVYLAGGNWHSIVPAHLATVGANAAMPNGLVFYA